MKITEMQDHLEDLQNNLSIVSETANAIESSLSDGILTVDNVRWALIGVIRDINNAVADSEKLVDAVIKIRSAVEGL